MKVRCDVHGLDCPHCASKLEGLLNKEEAIQNAQLNYAMHSLVLEVADDADEEEIVALAQKVATGFEDGVTIELRD